MKNIKLTLIIAEVAKYLGIFAAGCYTAVIIECGADFRLVSGVGLGFVLAVASTIAKKQIVKSSEEQF